MSSKRKVYDRSFKLHAVSLSSERENKKEGVWLNGKGRRILIEAIGEMWLETIDHAGRRKTRREHLREDLRDLRTEILRWFEAAGGRSGKW